MQRENPSPRISDIERGILRALCQQAGAGAALVGPLRELRNYRWHEPEHRVVYEAIEEVSKHGSRSLRDYLPARAARMGFPDLDWAAYFEPPEPAAVELPELLRELKAALRK
jgi:hypothetical protein